MRASPVQRVAMLLLYTPRRRRRRRRRLAERGSRVPQLELNHFGGRVRTAEHAPRDPFYLLKRLHALAKIVEWEWYRARLVNVRIRSPRLQIEYMATIEGDESQLALPVPRVNYVPLEHVRLDEPEQSDAPVVLPTTPCVTVSPA